MAKSPLASLYGTSKLLEFIAFAFAAIAVLKTNHDTSLRKIAVCLAIGILVSSIVAIGQVMHQGSLGGLWYFLGERTFSAETPGIANASINGALVLRPYATFPHPNVLSWYLFFGIVICIGALMKSVRTKPISLSNGLLVLATLLGAPALFLTLSRSVILLFILFLVLLPLQLTKNLRNRGPILLGYSLIVALFIGILLFPRFQTLFAGDTAVSQREALLAAALNMILHSPVTGVGVANFLVQLPAFYPAGKDVLLQPVHNIFLLVFAETGMIGIGLFLWALVRVFQITTKTKDARIRSLLLLLLLSSIGIGMVDHYFLTLEQGQILFTLLLSMGIAYGSQ